MRRSNWVRASAAVALAVVVALQTADSVDAQPATQVVTVVAVRDGEPVNGYHVINRETSPNIASCQRPSPAAVSADIYACDPAQALAQVCWPATASVLCLVDPWSMALRRFPSEGLPPVGPPPTPMPFAMLLDDGTRCILPNGVDWGGRADDMYPVYGCNPANTSQGVVVPRGWAPVTAIDRSKPQWTVRLGELGPRDTPFAFPRLHTVTTAWFAGS